MDQLDVGILSLDMYVSFGGQQISKGQWGASFMGGKKEHSGVKKRKGIMQ